MLSYLRIHFNSLASIWIRALSVLAGFVITFYIGRAFGPLASGQYALVTQTAMFLSIVAVGGMDMAVVRKFSATVVRRIPLSPGSLIRAIAYSVGAGLIIAVILTIGSTPLFALLFGKYIPEQVVAITCLVLLARTTTRLTSAVMRSQGAHITAQTVEVLVIPVTVSALLVLHVVETLPALLWATAVVGLVAAGFGIVRSFHYTGRGEETVDVKMREMFRISLPLWLTAIALNIADWYGLATAARMLGVYEAGLFRIAFQIAGALTFVAMGMYSVFTARISAALEAGDIYHVARLSRSATRLAIVTLSPAVIFLMVFAETLLGYIRPEFVSAAPLLKILLIGQFVYVATGPSGLVLAMTGHERLNFAISGTVTAALLVVAPVATYLFGLTGLAVAMALVPIAGNMANLVTVYRLERINVVTGHYREPPEADEPEEDEPEEDGDGDSAPSPDDDPIALP